MSSSSHVGLHVSVGVSGAGKTYGIRQSVYRAAISGMPVIVIDRMKEWSSVPPELGHVTSGARHVASPNGLAGGPHPSAIELITKGARLVIVRPDDPMAATVQAAQWAKSFPGPAGVAIPEAHRVAPCHRPLHPHLEDVACAWRHYNVSLWCDTQRLALISKTILENARDLKLYAVVGARDFGTVNELGGRELVDAVRRCAQRLSDGDPGWHVSLSVSRLPPYVITKDGPNGTMREPLPPSPAAGIKVT